MTDNKIYKTLKQINWWNYTFNYYEYFNAMVDLYNNNIRVDYTSKYKLNQLKKIYKRKTNNIINRAINIKYRHFLFEPFNNANFN